jgi:hypothetical protein
MMSNIGQVQAYACRIPRIDAFRSKGERFQHCKGKIQEKLQLLVTLLANHTDLNAYLRGALAESEVDMAGFAT